MCDHLIDCLRDVADNPFIPEPTSASLLLHKLKSLADALLGESDGCESAKLPLGGWSNCMLFALDLEANPRRVGDWDFNVEFFPLRPGRRGVTWSREHGYEVCEDDGGYSSDEDEEDTRSREAFLEKQRRLGPNIETFCALSLNGGECDPVPVDRYSDSDRGPQTDSEDEEDTPGVYNKHFDRRCLDYDELLSCGGFD